MQYSGRICVVMTIDDKCQLHGSFGSFAVQYVGSNTASNADIFVRPCFVVKKEE